MARNGEDAPRRGGRRRAPTSCCSTCGCPISTASRWSSGCGPGPRSRSCCCRAPAASGPAWLALDAGADDFIDKPFSMEELRARVGAALRRVARTQRHGRPQPAALAVSGDLRSTWPRAGSRSPGTRSASPRCSGACSRPSSPTPGKLLTYRDIIAAVWSPQHGDEARDALRVHLRTLRPSSATTRADPALHRDRGRGRLPLGGGGVVNRRATPIAAPDEDAVAADDGLGGSPTSPPTRWTRRRRR